MAVRLIKSSWWVDFRYEHRRFRRRSPQNSKTGAKTYEFALRQRLARGDSLDRAPPSDQMFGSFAWRWYQEYVIPNNKYSEQYNKKYLLSSILVPFFGKTLVGNITSFQIEQFKAQAVKRGLSNKTINNYLTALNKLLSSAFDWLSLAHQPPKAKLLKCKSERTDFLSLQESAELLGATSGVVHELVLAALRTGMRLGELKGLQWADVDWDNRMLRIRNARCDRQKVLTTTKSGRERSMPLDADLYRLLELRRKQLGYVFVDADGSPFDHYRLRHRLDAACKAAGIRRITWHVLRHTFASHLAMKGVPLHAVQALLGHSNITTTMRYAHVAPGALREAIDVLGKLTSPLAFGQPVGNRASGSEWRLAA